MANDHCLYTDETHYIPVDIQSNPLLNKITDELYGRFTLTL